MGNCFGTKESVKKGEEIIETSHPAKVIKPRHAENEKKMEIEEEQKLPITMEIESTEKEIVIHKEIKCEVKENQKMHLPPESEAKLLDKFPGNPNRNTSSSLEQFGEFKFGKLEKECEELPTMGPYLMETGMIYIGQWKNGKKHGKGVQIWPDGSRYDGFFENGLANGRGRLIHADGDVYEGQWKDEKAHGKGRYKGINGVCYDGD